MDEFTTSADGTLIEGFSVGDYYVIEVDAAEGYYIGTQLEFSIGMEDAGQTITINLTDTEIEILPSTGGIGLLLLILTSLSRLIITTSVTLKKTRKHTILY